jgi:hypothetical protein
MGLFKKRPAQQAPAASTAAPTVAESLEKLVETAGRPSLFAHSEFVKLLDCPRCGGRKRLPSKTAYLYCDYCGSLIDYDFRLANSGTSAGLTNTVFHQLIAPVQGELGRARAAGDTGRYRELLRGVYAEWLRQCPQAASPRVKTDADFRDRMAAYCAESQLRKDFDPGLAALERQMNAVIATLQRRPNGTGPWLVSDGARCERRHLRVLWPQAGHRRRRDPVPQLRRPAVIPGGHQRSRVPVLPRRHPRGIAAVFPTITEWWRRSSGAPRPPFRGVRRQT